MADLPRRLTTNMINSIRAAEHCTEAVKANLQNLNREGHRAAELAEVEFPDAVMVGAMRDLKNLEGSLLMVHQTMNQLAVDCGVTVPDDDEESGPILQSGGGGKG